MSRLIFLTVLALGTTAAQADSGLFYLGAGATYSLLTETYDGFIAYDQTDLNNAAWKAFAGVRPLKWLALEADYIDLGSGYSGTTYGDTYHSTTHADSSAWAAYVVGFLPLEERVVDVYGKLGVAYWKLKANLITYSYTAPPPSLTPIVYVDPKSFSGTNIAWGIGIQTHFKMLGVRLEYEGIPVNNNAASVFSLSVFLSL